MPGFVHESDDMPDGPVCNDCGIVFNDSLERGDDCPECGREL